MWGRSEGEPENRNGAHHRGTEDTVLFNGETLKALERGGDDQKGKQNTCFRIHPYPLILRAWTTGKGTTAISLNYINPEPPWMGRDKVLRDAAPFPRVCDHVASRGRCSPSVLRTKEFSTVSQPWNFLEGL